MASPGLRIGLVVPHLRLYGGIRRLVEFANRLSARGHRVVFLVPDGEPLVCTWMPCAADVRPLTWGTAEAWDIVLFAHEPQWVLLERFKRARRTIFYALHFGATYGKECSWEALWAPVDLQLANSGWTADRVAEVTGVRPTVQLGGVNRDTFHPWDVPRTVPLLCVGDDRRPWKGTDTIVEAARRAGVPLDRYAPKHLSQEELGRAYSAAQVFAVGSWYEGFCQPGLEALACGAPLVTTDNGGCREYAIDGETALVVPPKDAGAMAEAVRRLLDDPELAQRLARNGLELVAGSFDWERRTDELAEVLDGVVAGMISAPPPQRPEAPDDPVLSVVVPAWDQLLLTQRFVQSVRAHTDVPYELIVVDNGSAPEAAHYAAHAGDRVVLNPTNRGFACGMNQGLAQARGRYVAFCNNDTVLPEAWASTLVSVLDERPGVGIVAPAVTAANNAISVREVPGTEVFDVAPFSAPPAAVVWVMRRAVVEELGGWSEEYPVASGEDVDLAFQVWVNELDIVVDERVLVDHISKGTATRLDDWRGLWAANRQRFLDKWMGDAETARLASCPPERHARNRDIARAVAGWMDSYFRAREQARSRTQVLLDRNPALRARAVELAWRNWQRVGPRLPSRVDDTARRVARRFV
jgi:GT2 family glycosyltransferase